MKNFVILLLLFVVQNALAVCSSPISRTNNTAGAVLTSTKYNLDLNTVYAKVNNLPGDCIVDGSITTAKIADEAVTAAKIAADVLAKFIPAGTILPYGGTFAPAGFLLCNGQAVSRTTYADLYTAIGTAFGSGNGSTTFNVPDLRGRFLRGVDGGVGRDPDRATRSAMSSGGNAGDLVGSVQDDAFETHNHAGLGNVSPFGAYGSVAGAGAFSGAGTFTVGLTSSSGGNETRPTNANVNFIIKI